MLILERDPDMNSSVCLQIPGPCSAPPEFQVPCPAPVHVVYATYVAGVLLGSPMALVDGTVGSEGRTALRKATGF